MTCTHRQEAERGEHECTAPHFRHSSQYVASSLASTIHTDLSVHWPGLPTFRVDLDSSVKPSVQTWQKCISWVSLSPYNSHLLLQLEVEVMS